MSVGSSSSTGTAAAKSAAESGSPDFFTGVAFFAGAFLAGGGAALPVGSVFFTAAFAGAVFAGAATVFVTVLRAVTAPLTCGCSAESLETT